MVLMLLNALVLIEKTRIGYNAQPTFTPIKNSIIAHNTFNKTIGTLNETVLSKWIFCMQEYMLATRCKNYYSNYRNLGS